MGTLKVTDTHGQTKDANYFESNSSESTLIVSTEKTDFDCTLVSQENVIERNITLRDITEKENPSEMKSSHENVLESNVSEKILLDIKQVKEITIKDVENNTNDCENNSKCIDTKEEIKSNEKKDEEKKKS